MTTSSSATPRRQWLGLSAPLDLSASAHRRAAALLVLVSLVAFVPGFFQIPPVDRDEAYFAEATKQMIKTGDYVDIRYQDAVRYRKPIGIYWLQAAAVKIGQKLGLPAATRTIWLYRLPSLFAAVGAVLATYWCALAFVSRRGAILAAVMLAASTSLGVEARLAKTDAVLLFTVVIAMAVLARAYLLSRATPASGATGAPHLDWLLPALFWTALAGGILVKGPVILMIVALTAAVLSIIDRSARWLKALRPLIGMSWLCLLVLPWLIAISLRAGGAFLSDSIGNDMLAKIASGQETHGAPPGYYLLLFPFTFFPGSMLAVLAAPAIWAKRSKPTVRFLLAWLVPSWTVFELVATKLPNYVLPLYPVIAILIAGAVDAKALSQRRWLVRGTIWWFLIPLIVSIAAITAAIMIDRNVELAGWPFLAAAIFCGFLAWRLYEFDGAERALMRAAAAAILTAIGVYSVVLPALTPAFPSVALANLLRKSTCKHPTAASAGYEEPSLVFLAGTATQLTDASGAADYLHQDDCRFAFVEAGELPAFLKRAQAIGLRYRGGPRIEGFNISTGRRITVAVFQSTGAR